MSIELPPSDNQPLRIKTIAEWLGVSDKTVRRRIEREEIKSTKMGGLRVVFRGDFNAYLQRIRGMEGANV